MTKWMYVLLGIGAIVASFNIVRLGGVNPIVDIGFMVLVVILVISLIFDKKK